MPDDLFLAASEADFQGWVTDLASFHGWIWTHFRPAQEQSGRWSTPLSGTAGWPDLVLARDNVVLFRELKSEKGKLSAEQAVWLRALHYAGCDADVWRPSDRATIERVLA